MKNFGLIGFPLTHSLSKEYFTNKFQKENISNCEYQLYSLPSIDLFPELIHTTPELSGLSVTIPYKESIINYLDELHPDAAEIKAVNVIKLIKQKENTLLKGFNTDWIAFKETLQKYLKPKHKQALVLGTGGASKAVCFALKKLNIPFHTVSRNRTEYCDYIYFDLNRQIIEEHQIIINTTPVGMFPKFDYYPLIPYRYINSNHLMYDLIYNPTETIFLEFGKENNATTVNGLEMLYLQAEKAWEIFTND